MSDKEEILLSDLIFEWQQQYPDQPKIVEALAEDWAKRNQYNLAKEAKKQEALAELERLEKLRSKQEKILGIKKLDGVELRDGVIFPIMKLPIIQVHDLQYNLEKWAEYIKWSLEDVQREGLMNTVGAILAVASEDYDPKTRTLGLFMRSVYGKIADLGATGNDSLPKESKAKSKTKKDPKSKNQVEFTAEYLAFNASHDDIFLIVEKLVTNNVNFSQRLSKNPQSTLTRLRNILIGTITGHGAKLNTIVDLLLTQTIQRMKSIVESRGGIESGQSDTLSDTYQLTEGGQETKFTSSQLEKPSEKEMQLTTSES